MFEKFKNFLNNIQNSNETTKRRWLIGATAVSMVLVIGLWLIYVKSTVVFPAGESQEATTGFWQIFKNGLVVVFNSIKENIKVIISAITKSRTITVE